MVNVVGIVRDARQNGKSATIKISHGKPPRLLVVRAEQVRVHLPSPFVLMGICSENFRFYRDSIVTKLEGSLELGVPDGI